MSGVADALLADLTSAWATICFQLTLIFAPTNVDLNEENFNQILQDAVRWVFTPRTKGRCIMDANTFVDENGDMYPSLRVECSFTSMSSIMSLGSLLRITDTYNGLTYCS